MSLKVLHLAAHLGPSQGILLQMRWEHEAAQMLGLPWTVLLVAPEGVYPAETVVWPVSVGFVPRRKNGKPWSVINWVLLRLQVVRLLRKRERDFDLILLRYSPHDPFQALWLRLTRTPVLLVSHTLELAELELGDGLTDRVRAWVERCLGPRAGRWATGYVGVTGEILEHQRRSMALEKFGAVYPNGVGDLGAMALDRRSDSPEFLFVASRFAPWHGLDLLFDALDADESSVMIHVVGEVPSELAERASFEPRVRLHGPLNQEQIREIAAACWVGLSAFGLGRKGMDEACALKVREYLALGLPVAAAYREVLPDGFPYFRRVEVSLELLCSFATEVRSVSRQAVHDAASPHISKAALLQRLYEQLNTGGRFPRPWPTQ